MSRTARATVPDGEPDLTAEEQAQLDQMRADDSAPQDDPPPIDDQPPQDLPADDQQGDPQADPQQIDKRPQMVPHAALHEERVRRQQVEQQAIKDRQMWEERFNTLLQRVPTPEQQQPAPQPGAPSVPPPLPDPQADPVGHIMARLQRSEDARTQQDQVLGAVVQALTQQNQLGQQAQQAQTVQQRALALEREFAATTPDYVEAVSYLNDLRHRQLVAAGWDDPAERQAIIAQEAMGIAARAEQAHRNPAEMVYQLAKASGHATQAVPAPPDPAIAPAQAPNASQRLAQIGNGQRQSQQSLGSVRGNAPPPLTAQRLLEMPNDEFEKMLATPEGKELMGS